MNNNSNVYFVKQGFIYITEIKINNLCFTILKKDNDFYLTYLFNELPFKIINMEHLFLLINEKSYESEKLFMSNKNNEEKENFKKSLNIVTENYKNEIWELTNNIKDLKIKLKKKRRNNKKKNIKKEK